MVLSIIQDSKFQYGSNLTTGMDRLHINTHSSKLVGKGVELNDVICHMVHLLL